MAKGWYVLHTYSGYENKIEKTIRIMIDQGELGSVVSDIKVPSEKVVDVKDGKRKERMQRVLPGYVLIEMDLPSIGWKEPCSKIRRIQGVTGFVGAGSNMKPNPISSEEAKSLLARMGEIKGDASYRPKQTFVEGESVRIIDGPFESFTGTIEEVHAEKSRLKVMVGIFGRNTPVDVEFLQVEKI
ncbi:transcription termination/antitermination protein NusG [Spirochaeta lutea]|uniref:Transcription termination/antitermination protein NusG n=1 Tax=Spirochaeta lutea TaxID=1480694 RepID=A0A098QT05_9SPIO|nr:transcription termination/antitermination protein NusG [Spirochaeta lutea]KGE70701.1 antitermination protein NusG [Spirochaeta lutea]